MPKRKAVAFLTACFLAFGTSAMPVQADETLEAETLLKGPVRIASIGMEMEVPAEWVTLTQEMAEDDPVFTENHMDGKTMIQNYKDHGILIDSIDMDNRVEFNVTLSGKDQNIVHLTQFSDEDITVYADGLTDTENESGISFHDYEIYDHDQVRFIAGEAEINNGGTTVGSGEQYYTIVNGNRLCFQMISFEGGLSQEDKDMFRSMIDTVHFDSLQEAGPLSIREGRNPILEQLSSKYLLRNIIIVLGAVLAVYYGIGFLKKKG